MSSTAGVAVRYIVIFCTVFRRVIKIVSHQTRATPSQENTYVRHTRATHPPPANRESNEKTNSQKVLHEPAKYASVAESTMTRQVSRTVAHFHEQRCPPHAFWMWNLDVAMAAEANADVAARDALAPVCPWPATEAEPEPAVPAPQPEFCCISWGFTQLGTGTMGPVVEHGVPPPPPNTGSGLLYVGPPCWLPEPGAEGAEGAVSTESRSDFDSERLLLAARVTWGWQYTLSWRRAQEKSVTGQATLGIFAYRNGKLTAPDPTLIKKG